MADIVNIYITDMRTEIIEKKKCEKRTYLTHEI